MITVDLMRLDSSPVVPDLGRTDAREAGRIELLDDSLRILGGLRCRDIPLARGNRQDLEPSVKERHAHSNGIINAWIAIDNNFARHAEPRRSVMNFREILWCRRVDRKYSRSKAFYLISDKR